MKIKNQNQGFTLIELLVVISIISVLSAITLSSLQVARTKAINSATTAQVRQVQNAIAMFYADNGRYPAPGARIICLSETCRIGGGVPLSFSLTGELATALEKANVNIAQEQDSFIKKAYAASLGQYIKIPKIKTPSIVNGSLPYEGVVYECATTGFLANSVCNDAKVFWPIKNTLVSNASNGTYYYQKADGTDVKVKQSGSGDY